MARQPLHSSLHKGDFFLMCERARERSLSEENIKSAWNKCGIYPFNRQRVLSNPQILSAGSGQISSHQDLRNTKSTTEIQSFLATEPSSLDEAKEKSVLFGNKVQAVEADLAVAKHELHLALTREKPAKPSRKVLSTARFATRVQLEHARHACLEEEGK